VALTAATDAATRRLKRNPQCCAQSDAAHQPNNRNPDSHPPIHPPNHPPTHQTHPPTHPPPHSPTWPLQVKYTTLAWRPITAFRAGYPGFTAAPTWTPLLNTPAHPEYPSGHQVSVGALLEVILDTLGGKDKVRGDGSVVFWVGGGGAEERGNGLGDTLVPPYGQEVLERRAAEG
jgi:hypothetical protein